MNKDTDKVIKGRSKSSKLIHPIVKDYLTIKVNKKSNFSKTPMKIFFFARHYKICLIVNKWLLA